MSYRFTKTEKWQDGWYRRLSPEAKLLFNYLCDNCDIAGFWEIDFENAAFHTGLDVQVVETAFKELEKCYLRNDKFIWLQTFLKHQKNLPLNPNVAAHRGVITRLSEHKDLLPNILEVLQGNIPQGVSKGLLNPTGKGKGRGRGKDRGKGNISSRCKKPNTPQFTPPTVNEVKKYATSINFPKLDAEYFCEYYTAADWKHKDGSLMQNWKLTVVSWKRREKQSKEQDTEEPTIHKPQTPTPEQLAIIEGKQK